MCKDSQLISCWEGNRKPLLFKILNWAVAAHLSKTGNFMFPLLHIATACITLLLHMFTQVRPQSHSHPCHIATLLHLGFLMIMRV